MQQHSLLFLFLLKSATLYGVCTPEKDDIADQINEATAQSAPAPTKKTATERFPKGIPTAGRLSDIKDAREEYTFFKDHAHSDIKKRCKNELPAIVSDRLNNVTCLVVPRKKSTVQCVYNSQRYPIINPQHELTGPLGYLLYELNLLNEKLNNRRWVCSCISKSNVLQLKPACGSGEVKTLVVPANKPFDVTLKKVSDSYYLTVYEDPIYTPKKDGWTLVTSE